MAESSSVQRYLPKAIGSLVIVSLGASVAFSPLPSLIAIGFIGLAALVIIEPRYSLYLLAVSLGVNVTLLSQPVHISLPQLVGLSVIAGLFLRLAMGRPNQTRRKYLWAWSGVLFTAFTLPSLMTGVSLSTSVTGTVHLIFLGFLIYAAVKLLEARPAVIERICVLVLLGALISTLPAFFQSALGVGPTSYYRGELMRAYSTYGQPNSYGHYLAGVIPLALGMLFRKRRYSFALIIITAALLLTGSRGAVAATALASLGLVSLAAVKSRFRVLMLVVTLTAAMAVFSFSLLPPRFLSHLLSLADWSTIQRLRVLETAWAGITHRPFLGFGVGSFPVAMSAYRAPGLVDDVEMPHNMLLEVWFEAGLPALLCFFALLLLYYRASVRAYARTGDSLLLALIGSFTGLIAASMFGTLVLRGIGEFLALIIGMTAGRLTLLQSQRSPK